jgi:hypothetical protein
LSAQHRCVTKLLLIGLAVVAAANALAPDRSDPPLLIDGAPPAAAPLDAHN